MAQARLDLIDGRAGRREIGHPPQLPDIWALILRAASGLAVSRWLYRKIETFW
jgi:hypothetical protein